MEQKNKKICTITFGLIVLFSQQSNAQGVAYPLPNGSSNNGTTGNPSNGYGSAFFGTNAGTINTGANNSFIGFYAGSKNTSGTANSFLVL